MPRQGIKALGSHLRKDEIDQALVDGLIDVRDYARYLVGVQPVVDNLYDPEENVRKNATFALKERRDRSAVELLERALDDPSEEVRLFAAEALERIDSTYNRAIYRLLALVEEHAGGQPCLLNLAVTDGDNTVVSRFSSAPDLVPETLYYVTDRLYAPGVDGKPAPDGGEPTVT